MIKMQLAGKVAYKCLAAQWSRIPDEHSQMVVEDSLAEVIRAAVNF